MSEKIVEYNEIIRKANNIDEKHNRLVTELQAGSKRISKIVKDFESEISNLEKKIEIVRGSFPDYEKELSNTREQLLDHIAEVDRRRNGEFGIRVVFVDKREQEARKVVQFLRGKGYAVQAVPVGLRSDGQSRDILINPSGGAKNLAVEISNILSEKINSVTKIRDIERKLPVGFDVQVSLY